MSLLPERKKSADEIAKLREAIGVPGHEGEVPIVPVAEAEKELVSAVAPPLAIEAKVVPAPVIEVSQLVVPPVLKVPVLTTPSAKTSHSLKRSERIEILPLEGNGDAPAPEIQKAPSNAETASGPPEAKPVRSLRKSEQIIHSPEKRVAPPADSSLPVHRHSDRQISEIRRQEMLAMAGSTAPPRPLNAPKFLVIIGYLLVIAGAVCVFFYDLPALYPAACLLGAAIVAGGIFVRKPLSRHHASFVGVLILLTAVFGALHYFPNL